MTRIEELEARLREAKVMYERARDDAIRAESAQRDAEAATRIVAGVCERLEEEQDPVLLARLRLCEAALLDIADHAGAGIGDGMSLSHSMLTLLRGIEECARGALKESRKT